jgi:DNA-binding response OmpR family regulator
VNILIVEDNSIMAKALKKKLKDGGYNVLVANSADVALKYIESHPFDLMITDINLEDEHVNGIDLVKKLNKTKSKPVIYLTAYGDDETLKSVSDTNHCYFLSKPYDSNQLLQIVKLTVYKYKLNNIEKVYLSENIIFDINNNILYKEDKEIQLTTKENLILTLLVYRKNQIVSNDDILQFVWQDELISPATMRKLISRMREKLDDITIETHHGLGYRLKV